MRYLAPTSTVMSLSLLAAATIRGIDYVKVPEEGITGTLSSITEMGISPGMLGTVFIVLGVLGTLMVLLHRWVPAALIHAFFGGIFLVLGIAAMSPVVAVGYGFRAPVSFVLVFAVVHICSAGVFLNRWWARRGRRKVRLDL